ncbi:uncharacterized protein DEA37_0013838 [Paragonimus westermani]|uniref:Integrase catalytic domain-containing protein n=1 Tax=Paragonimus westermani TaxID=34504 RepID=A0A5J4P1T8_9TREM|nr:uncharacterized protein DEA37_0013838 [Paragonimus westermani]
MSNQEAFAITSSFVTEWVACFGIPIQLHSDQGVAFESRLLEQTVERLNVVHKISAQHQSKSQHYQRSCYNRRASGPVYRIGDYAQTKATIGGCPKIPSSVARSICNCAHDVIHFIRNSRHHKSNGGCPYDISQSVEASQNVGGS